MLLKEKSRRDMIAGYEEEIQKLLEGTRRYPGSNSRRELPEREIISIKNYLRNPTANGIWRLSAKWNGQDSICRYLKLKFESIKAQQHEIIIPFGKENLKFDLNNIDIEKEINKFTFIIRLFIYMYYFSHFISLWL
mgnify:CR=1 FL=1